MAHLIACDDCERVYDATSMTVGERFRCHCGGVVRVVAPRTAHEEPARRCAACGGPCEARATSCGYCGADLLKAGGPRDSTCPSCFASVSGKGAYCHACGHALAATAVPVSPPVDAVCPCCQRNGLLHERHFADGVGGWECRGCAGLWLPQKAFERLAVLARQGAVPRIADGQAVRPPSGDQRQAGSFYRPCPVCGNLMNRRNYGRSSGVIIDACGDHGIWFDADELAQILTHVGDHGLEDRPKPKPRPTAVASMEPVRSERHPVLEAVEEVLGFLFGGNNRW